MASMYLDSIQRELLNLLQVDFPLTREPYTDLGLRLGIDGNEVIHRIGQLREQGIVRQVSPVLNAWSLGSRTTLAAMRVAESQVDKAEQLIIGHPGVSHGYERAHDFNLWFTLAVPAKADMENELQQLVSPIGAEAILMLPSVRTFKIGAYFDMGGNGQPVTDTSVQSAGVASHNTELSQTDRLIINEIQQDLALIPTPFNAIAERLGMDVEYLLAQCQSLQQRGVIRRFGAFISHNRAGFKANAMTCWVAPPDTVAAAGRRLAELREVSHCYERKTNPLWQYNLFAMIHSHTKETCQDIARQISCETGLTEYVLLFSTREFKKVRIKYLV